jgi:ABC-type spermidine/putrescine transport system permease subunit I
MFLNDSDLRAIWLTMRLAGIVTLILLLLGTPIAYGRRAARCGGGVWRVQ